MVYIYTPILYIYICNRYDDIYIYTHKVGNPVIRLPFGDGVYYPKTM